jgi:hypothetical protein
LSKITTEAIRAFIRDNNMELRCTQTEICTPLVNRLYKKMINGLRFKGIRVCEGLICDGHHRYLAALLAGVPLDVDPWLKSGATAAIEWHSVSFTEDDYDTLEEIMEWNEEDADFNNISIDSITSMLQ